MADDDLQLAVALVDLDRAAVGHLALQQLLGQRVLQVALDRALQGPGAVDRIVPDAAEPAARGVGQVERVQKLLKDRKIELDLTDAARRWLGRVGYDPVYGARPLKRAVQRYLQDPLAEKLLQGEVPDGSTVKVDEGDGELKIAVG